VSESIASNGFLPSGSYDDSEDKPMLIMKKSAEGHSLTALINRQLQEEHVPLLGRTSYTTKTFQLYKPNTGLGLNSDDASCSPAEYTTTSDIPPGLGEPRSGSGVPNLQRRKDLSLCYRIALRAPPEGIISVPWGWRPQVDSLEKLPTGVEVPIRLQHGGAIADQQTELRDFWEGGSWQVKA
ncbi:hypothetical protein EVAR_69312_1, partial [Eumeta japonica]